jgi:hypothetical protein
LPTAVFQRPFIFSPVFLAGIKLYTTSYTETIYKKYRWVSELTKRGLSAIFSALNCAVSEDAREMKAACARVGVQFFQEPQHYEVDV